MMVNHWDSFSTWKLVPISSKVSKINNKNHVMSMTSLMIRETQPTFLGGVGQGENTELILDFRFTRGFPDSSVGKESTCNSGDPSSIPGSGRSAGGRIAYPLQYSWAPLVAQLVKNTPAMQNWVQFLGWEDPLEKGKAIHSSILTWRIPWTV